jgi:hypothetical protein
MLSKQMVGLAASLWERLQLALADAAHAQACPAGREST